MSVIIPRILIAGLAGDSGKTITSLSLIHKLRQQGREVAVFKKGPDYIDAAWLGQAASKVCRNLDTYMLNPVDVVANFVRGSQQSDIAVIEGNRGIFDGRDVDGTHSTAELAKLLQVPVVLCVDATKTTRTLAALIKGCQVFDPQVEIAAIILNKVAGERHCRIVSDAIYKYCNLPVVGVIPKLAATIIPDRHLGLIPPAEFTGSVQPLLCEIGEEYLEVATLEQFAQTAAPLQKATTKKSATDYQVTIGYFYDSVFTFYYPENLEALQQQGAQLTPISSLNDKCLPAIDALYIGGGFPESFVKQLSQKQTLLNSVNKAATAGLPIYAECGGLMYLSRSIKMDDKTYPMANVFPVDLELSRKPVGHGYTLLNVDRINPFFEIGTVIKGHEFHYSQVVNACEQTCMQVQVGVGLGKKRDGLVWNSTMATYTHIHATGVKNWAQAIVRNARKYKTSNNSIVAFATTSK